MFSIITRARGSTDSQETDASGDKESSFSSTHDDEIDEAEGAAGADEVREDDLETLIPLNLFTACSRNVTSAGVATLMTT